MISVVLLLVTIVSAYVVVAAGAAAYELTGLERSTAHFQALSAFTGTGFTTKISERVVSHPVRRRITIILIVLGYAGGATVIASLVTSVNTESLGLSLRNLAVLAVLGPLALIVLRRVGRGRTGRFMRRVLARRLHEEVTHEELLRFHRGYGVSRIEVPKESAARGRTLAELGLPARELLVLAVEAGDRAVPVPPKDWVVEEGQLLLLYGKLRGVTEVFRPGGVSVPPAAGGSGPVGPAAPVEPDEPGESVEPVEPDEPDEAPAAPHE